MSAEQIRKLNRDKTEALAPGGILEEHGPCLPSFTDGYWNERLTKKILDGLDERQIVRFGDEMKKSEPDVMLDEESLKHEAKIKRSRMNG
jgi:hypothetical protein